MDRASSLLIDCGRAQGAGPSSGDKGGELGFDIEGIVSLAITHMHLDHVGRILALFAVGFRDPILYSKSSARLLLLVLKDAYWLEASNEPGQMGRYIGLLHRIGA